MTMTPSPTIHLTGNPPDRHGWRINCGTVAVASSIRRDMTAEAAMDKAKSVLERMRQMSAKAEKGEK